MAARFDTASDRVHYTGGGLPDPEAGFTITAWVYISVDRDDFSTFARLSSAGGTAALFATTADGTGGPIYGTAGGTLTAASGMTAGAWYRLAATCTGTSGVLYTAAATGSTATQSGTVDGASAPDQICLGGRADTDATEWFNGRIAYVRLWSTVLSQAQIEAEWASAAPVVTAALVADWPLVTAGDLTDHSGNGRHLTAGSTAVTTEAGPFITGETTAAAPAASAALAAVSTTAGATDTSAPTPTAILAGTSTTTGSLDAEAPHSGSVLAGTVTGQGTLGATAPLPVTTQAGTVTTVGTVSAASPAVAAAFAAALAITGVITATSPAPGAVFADGAAISWPPRAGSITVRRVAHGTVSIR